MAFAIACGDHSGVLTTTMTSTFDLDQVVTTLNDDGICGMPGAFSEEFVSRANRECLEHSAYAYSYSGGTANRGRNRRYFAFHPEETSLAVEILTHPWFVAVCETVLGPGYQIAEYACDVSWPGSLHQKWHRDFPSDIGMDADGNLLALAFNIPTVATTDVNGPLELIHGTHRDAIPTPDGMFPDEAGQAAYETHPGRTLKYAKLGSMSVRTPLAIHRGTPNQYAGPRMHQAARPVMVVTVYAGGVDLLEGHTALNVSAEYHERLPSIVRDHLHCEVVDRLEPIVQKHTIEGLVMGE